MKTGIVSVVILAFLAACSSDTRTRYNESHITIHQYAGYNDPVIGWATENGTPSEGNVRTSARFLELAVLGNADHPTKCVVSIEHAVTDELDEDPGYDDPTLIGDDNPKTERSYTILCSESPNSTRISWPDGSIVLTGHIEGGSDDETSSGENKWAFTIDHIERSPRTAKFEPEDSFEGSQPIPEPT
jgi:hypothetical protein